MEAGNVMEMVLEETIAFSEMIGTIVANNADPQNLPKFDWGEPYHQVPP